MTFTGQSYATALECLKSHATSRALHHRHSLGKWTSDGQVHEYAECTACGHRAYVTLDPGQKQVTGMATDYLCKGRK